MADRDKRTPLTPPQGVREQISRAEEWEDGNDLTPIQPTPIPGTLHPSMHVPVDMHGIDRRVKETKNASITMLDRVELYRKETREDLGRLETKLMGQDKKLDAMTTVVGDLKGAVGKAAGQNELIISILKEQQQTRANTEHVVTTTRIAEVEVDKTRQLTELEIHKAESLVEIENKKEKAKLRIELVKTVALKALAGIGAIWAVISVAYLSKCGG